jgi:hypothetical protein
VELFSIAVLMGWQDLHELNRPRQHPTHLLAILPRMWPLTGGQCKRECCRSTQEPSSFRLIFQSLVRFYLRLYFQRLPSHFSHMSSYCKLLNPSWEAISCLATQEISIILWNPKDLLSCSQEPAIGPYPGARWIQSTHVYHISLRSILILSAYIGSSFLVVSLL